MKTILKIVESALKRGDEIHRSWEKKLRENPEAERQLAVEVREELSCTYYCALRKIRDILTA